MLDFYKGLICQHLLDSYVWSVTFVEDVMQCPKCGTDSKAERKFCSKCGAKLENVCPECGFSNEPDDAFCGGCGAKLTDTPSTETAIPRLEDVQDRLYIPEPLRKEMDAAEQELQGENRLVTACQLLFRGGVLARVEQIACGIQICPAMRFGDW